MFPKYANQNHAVHRSPSPMAKTASVYEKQAMSNRREEDKSLVFSSLAPFESEAIIQTIQKEARQLEGDHFEKTAAPLASPFEHFRTAKNYIASKLGLADESAHDLASSVVARAETFTRDHGEDMTAAIGGIIDSMEPLDIQQRVGALPMRQASQNETEEQVKTRLIEELQLSSFQADQITKSVMAQVKNLTTQFRNATNDEIANAVVNVLVNHQDTSVVYSISSSARFKAEVETYLNQN